LIGSKKGHGPDQVSPVGPLENLYPSFRDGTRGETTAHCAVVFMSEALIGRKEIGRNRGDRWLCAAFQNMEMSERAKAAFNQVQLR